MKKFSTKILVTIILIAAAVGLIIFLNFPITGFVGIEPPELPARTTENFPLKTKQINSNEQNEITTSSENVSLDFYYQVIEPTKLSARLVKGNLLPCPQYSELHFEVKNTGKTTAERVFVEYPSNLKVLNCINCSLKQLNAGQSTRIKLNACKTENNKISVEFSSVNATKQTVEIKVEK